MNNTTTSLMQAYNSILSNLTPKTTIVKKEDKIDNKDKNCS